MTGHRRPIGVPLHDESVPVACTLDATELPERLALLERLRARLDHLEPTEHGLLLHFPDERALEDELRRFAEDEQRCCAFWGFAVARDADEGLTLRWDAPPTAAAALDRIGAFFTGAEPAATALEGLL